MSCIRYFNSVPHIVRYGMQDEKEGKCWIIFWRCGVGFKISVSRTDIAGTRFEKKWTELNKEPIPGRGGWVHRWEQFCDCVLSQCLDLLDELAPDNSEYWMSLRDYVHSPSYDIKMVTDEKINDANGVVTSGPTSKGAYELKPLSLEEAGIEVEVLPRYNSDQLYVEDREIDWRAPPHRVREGGERHFAFKHIDRSSHDVETGKVSNWSLDSIKAYLRIRKHCETRPEGSPDRIPKVLGYVVDDAGKPQSQALREGEETRTEPILTSEDQFLVAGILVTDFPHFRALGDLVRDAKKDSALLDTINENKNAWKAQTLQVVQEMHARDMAFGQNSHSWPYISQWCIHIDNEPAVWLDPPSGVVMADEKSGGVPSTSDVSVETNEDFLQRKAQDLEAVTNLFDVWLPGELEKISGAA